MADSGEDARRTLELLWRASSPGTRGPKQSLSVDDVVQTAVALADREGERAVTMRNLARELGRSPMALYTYVKTREQLLELMYDWVLRELEASPPGTLRARVETLARSWWQLYLRHPWLLELTSQRSSLGPNELHVTEQMLVTLADTGLSPRDCVACTHALTSYVRGAAHAILEARGTESVSQVTDDNWWAERAQILADVAGDLSERFPTLARVQAEGGYAPDGESSESYLASEANRAFDFGLSCFVEGLQAKLGAAASSGRAASSSKSTRDPRRKR